MIHFNINHTLVDLELHGQNSYLFTYNINQGYTTMHGQPVIKINHTVQLHYSSVIVNSFCPTTVHIYISQKHGITLHLTVLLHNLSSSTYS